jgi:calcineurin-like phosphoesterase family protein
MATFFTADTHFSHGMLVGRRGFDTHEEMDEDIIRRWNEVVRPNDDVWHLGDVTLARSEHRQRVLQSLGRLNGRKRLLIGNHDPQWVIRADVWYDPPKHYNYLRQHGLRINLMHYPMGTWNKRRAGAWMLHGHCHGARLTSLPTGGEHGRILDVGYEVFGRPMELEEIREIIEDADRVSREVRKEAPPFRTAFQRDT